MAALDLQYLSAWEAVMAKLDAKTATKCLLACRGTVISAAARTELQQQHVLVLTVRAGQEVQLRGLCLGFNSEQRSDQFLQQLGVAGLQRLTALRVSGSMSMVQHHPPAAAWRTEDPEAPVPELEEPEPLLAPLPNLMTPSSLPSLDDVGDLQELVAVRCLDLPLQQVARLTRLTKLCLHGSILRQNWGAWLDLAGMLAALTRLQDLRLDLASNIGPRMRFVLPTSLGSPLRVLHMTGVQLPWHFWTNVLSPLPLLHTLLVEGSASISMHALQRVLQQCPAVQALALLGTLLPNASLGCLTALQGLTSLHLRAFFWQGSPYCRPQDLVQLTQLRRLVLEAPERMTAPALQPLTALALLELLVLSAPGWRQEWAAAAGAPSVPESLAAYVQQQQQVQQQMLLPAGAPAHAAILPLGDPASSYRNRLAPVLEFLAPSEAIDGPHVPLRSMVVQAQGQGLLLTSSSNPGAGGTTIVRVAALDLRGVDHSGTAVVAQVMELACPSNGSPNIDAAKQLVREHMAARAGQGQPPEVLLVELGVTDVSSLYVNSRQPVLWVGRWMYRKVVGAKLFLPAQGQGLEAGPAPDQPVTQQQQHAHALRTIVRAHQLAAAVQAAELARLQGRPLQLSADWEPLMAHVGAAAGGGPGGQ